MQQQVLDDIQRFDEKHKLRTPLIEKIEVWGMIAVGLSILYDFYSIILWGITMWIFETFGISLIILAYFISWKKASIAFDSNPQQTLFSLSESLKILQIICGLVLLWKCYGCASSIWYFVGYLFEGVGVSGMINWFVMLIIHVALTGLGIFYLILNDKATKYVNRI